MKIEVLYVPDCPHHPAALLTLHEILAAEGVAAAIHQVAVLNLAMAKALRFCGSPTIRINGRDVEGESKDSSNFAMSCRLYPRAKEPGVPPVEVIRRAVRKARATENS